MQAALHLVGLLVVLVRPHVVGKRARQRIEGELFQPVAERGVAGDGERALQRKHVFDHRAQLGTLRRIAAREMLVAGEHAVGQAVVLVQFGDHFQNCGSIGRLILRRATTPGRSLRPGRCSRRAWRARDL